MEEQVNNIQKKVGAFQRRYYFDFFVRGAVLTVLVWGFYFLFISLLEYTLWMGKPVRLVLFISLLAALVGCLLFFLKKPLAWWLYRKGLSQEESARIIGSCFPSVSDRLVNLVQLSRQHEKTPLLKAGIVQKAKALESVAFKDAVDLGRSKRYLWGLVPPLGIACALLAFAPSTLIDSGQRLIHFNREFAPPAPFSFHLHNPSLRAFAHEDFTVRVGLEGETLPEAVYLRSGDKVFKMTKDAENEYLYTFDNIDKEWAFRFEANGWASALFRVRLIRRPELTRFGVSFDFPDYLSRPDEALLNTGSFEVPEGTHVTWDIGVRNAAEAQIGFSPPGISTPMHAADSNRFTYRRQVRTNRTYWMSLSNTQARQKDSIAYAISVVKDQYPRLRVRQTVDSTLFGSVLLRGLLADDYGLSGLTLRYRRDRKGKPSTAGAVSIAIRKGMPRQPFSYLWRLDSLGLTPGETLVYFLQVTDNDGVNGHKATRSPLFTFVQPTEKEFQKELARGEAKAEKDLNESIKSAKTLGDMIDETRQKLSGKRTLKWEDKQRLESIIHQRDSLYKSMEELARRHRLLNDQRNAFLEQDERIAERARQIQKLMETLLDDETKALFEELRTLLERAASPSQVKSLLDKMSKREVDLEKSFNRMLALLNRFKFDLTLDQTIRKLDREKARQKKLRDATRQMNADENVEQDNDRGALSSRQRSANDSLLRRQRALSEQSEQLKDALDSLQKMAKEAAPHANTPAPQEMGDIQHMQQKSEQSLERKDHEESQKWQRQAIDKMTQMNDRLKSLQNALESEGQAENLEALKHLLHGLIKLSFDQEALLEAFASVRSVDPRYKALSRRQVTVENDFNILKDSLLRLSERDPFIGSVAPREIASITDRLERALNAIRERKDGNGRAEMQWAMTGINNLALLLDSYFDNLSEMASRAGKGSPSNQQPRLSELQKQLNRQIQELKKSGKTGRELSEGLARMAAEQEQIRRAFQDLQQRLEKSGGKAPGEGIPGQMEETEKDLINKRLTQQTIERQQRILSRLLEAEKAAKEQELDERRKGEAAKERRKTPPAILQEYLEQQRKEAEFFKTVPPKLNPYYKEEVWRYFRRTMEALPRKKQPVP